MNKVLIFGGAGFIGSHLADYHYEKGDKVTIVDNLETGSKSNIVYNVPLSPKIKYDFYKAEAGYWLDNNDNQTKFNLVYHLASMVGVDFVMQHPNKMMHSLRTTDKIIQFCQKIGASLLFTSTSEVYGLGNPPFAENSNLIFSSPPKPRWIYAQVKLLNEQQMLLASNTIPISIARLFNTTGPRQSYKFGMVLPKFINCIKQNQDIKVYGNGKQIRCFADVRDIVPCLYKILENSKNQSGEIFNVGNDKPISIMDLAIKTVEICNKKNHNIINIPYPWSSSIFEDMLNRQPDLKKLKTLMPDLSFRSLETTITDMFKS